MKTTIKIFIWIGMLLFGFLIYPIILGIKAYRMIDNTDATPNELNEMSVLTLFFVSPIAGILMFALDRKNLRQINKRQTIKENNQSDKEETNDVFGSLKLVHNLYKDELISKETYSKKKKQILGNLKYKNLNETMTKIPPQLVILHLIISFFWFALMLLTVFGGFAYSTLDLILLFYIILSSLLTYAKINELIKTIKVTSYLNFFLMIFFFIVIAPGYEFSGIVPLMAIFAGLQFLLSLSTIIILNKKDNRSLSLSNPEEIIKKAKQLYEEGLLTRDEIQILVNEHL